MNNSESGLRQAEALLEELRQRGLTLSVAESLTGGALCSALVAIPGASDVLQGGVVSYSNAVKQQVLGVAGEMLDSIGAVNEETAVQMAEGVRKLLNTDFAMATTGVAGPGPQDGIPAGTVFVAVSAQGAANVRQINANGDRAAVREAATVATIELCLAVLRGVLR